LNAILLTVQTDPTRAKLGGEDRRLNPKSIEMHLPLASQLLPRPTQLQISIQLPTNTSICRQRQDGRKPVELD
jgi:hypothetical protein